MAFGRVECNVSFVKPNSEWTDPVLSLVDWFPPRWRQLVATVLVACGVTLTAWPAAARSAFDLSQLDLRLNPADVAPETPPLVPRGPVRPNMHGQSVPEIVGDVDQVRQTETPNRRVAGAGPWATSPPTMGCSRSCSRTRRFPCFG